MRKYFSKNKTNLESLLSINHRVWVAWYPVQHHRPETLLQQDWGSLHQVASLLSLILSGVSGKSTAKLSKLLESNFVPAPQRLCHDGDELNPLLPAQLLSIPALVIKIVEIKTKQICFFAGSQLLAQVKQREHSDFWALSASSTQTSYTPPSPIIALPCHSLALLKFVQILDLSKLLHGFF